MGAEVITFSRHSKGVHIPVFVTHDQEGKYVRIPQGLLQKKRDEGWFDYSRRLWVGVYEANARDDIRLTVHLKLSEADRMLHELNTWAFCAKMVDGGVLWQAVEERLAGLSIHGIRFKLDLAE